MPEEKGGGSSSRFVFSSGGGTPAQPFETIEMPGRQRFSVELRPDETTVISWKKLVKDSQRTIQTTAVQPPAGAHPALEARIAPEAHIGDSDLHKDALPPPPNRFSAVIEKIERLYKGGQSSDEEELDDVPDDDQYDTEDSFIDDEELDEYFSVDKSKTKHSGFFINRGKLERVNEPASSPVNAPKKRKRKDMKKKSGEDNVEEMPKKLLKVGGVRMKAAARSAPLVGMNVVSSGQVGTSLAVSDHSVDKTSENQEVKVTQNQASTSGYGPSKADKHKESVNKEEAPISMKVSHKDVSKAPLDMKEGGKLKSSILGSKENFVKGTVVVELSDGRNSNRSEKNDPLPAESQTRKYTKDVGEMATPSKIRTTEKVRKGSDSRDVNIFGNKLLNSRIGNQAPAMKTAKQRKKSSTTVPKEDSPGRPKGSALERAIQELERSVAELCPPTMDIQEPDQSSQGVKRRMPEAVKIRLAKVARLAEFQGKISEELHDRLMSIVGHLIQLKTLKRNMKSMIETGQSARQVREGRLQDMKREVTEMVKMRVSSLKSKVVEQPECSSDDFQVAPGSAERGSLSGRYKWDNATEDRLCDLYDQYIEGMDEHKGPQIRKLYLELAELWPEGWMDNHGIKDAVYRAKERKKRLNKVGKGGDKSKRKKVSVKATTDNWTGDENAASESNVNGQAFAAYDKQIGLERVHNVSVNGGNILQCKLAKRRSPSIIDEKGKYAKPSIRKDWNNVRQWNKREGTPMFKKKLKRKPDIDTENTSTHSVKISSFHGKEMHKVGKQVLHGSSLRNKGSPEVADLPACESVKFG